MITISTIVTVKNVTARAISDFMLHCTDAQYQTWWPGTHFAFHTLKRSPDNVGNTVIFDEMIGQRRLKFTAVVIEALPGKRVVWQMTKGVKLPGWLVLEFEDTPDGVEILHTLKVGFGGPGRILDPLIRIYLSKDFEEALNEHARTEFTELAEILS